MQTRMLLGYSIELDREATQKWYDSSQGWGCEFAHCRHFLALARKGSLLGAILSTPANEDRILSDQVRCCHEPYPYGAPDFLTPHFDLEFYVTLPHIPKHDPI